MHSGRPAVRLYSLISKKCRDYVAPDPRHLISALEFAAAKTLDSYKPRQVHMSSMRLWMTAPNSTIISLLQIMLDFSLLRTVWCLLQTI